MTFTPEPTLELGTLSELRLEHHFRHFAGEAPWLLCTSDVEAYRLDELLELADERTLALWQGLTLGYTAPSGHPLLRAEIAGLYEHVEPDDVLTCAGADEAIFLAMSAILRRGDHAVVAWPGYESLASLAGATGAEVSRLHLDPESGWGLDLEALRRVLRRETRLIVVNYPHNPTGTLLDRATLEGLAALAGEIGAVLLCDEVYRLLEYDPGERLPAGVDLGRHGLSIGVMSKAFGLAGLRVGWLASRDRDLLQRVAALKDYTSGCLSAPSEVLALVALRSRERVLARSRALLARNLALLDSFFADWEGVLEWVRPRAGCVAYPRLLTGEPVEQFAARLTAEEGVMLVPGAVYGDFDNRFRIGFGHADMPEALARLDRFLRRRGERA